MTIHYDIFVMQSQSTDSILLMRGSTKGEKALASSRSRPMLSSWLPRRPGPCHCDRSASAEMPRRNG